MRIKKIDQVNENENNSQFNENLNLNLNLNRYKIKSDKCDNSANLKLPKRTLSYSPRQSALTNRPLLNVEIDEIQKRKTEDYSFRIKKEIQLPITNSSRSPIKSRQINSNRTEIDDNNFKSAIPFTIDDRETISKLLSIVNRQDEIINTQNQKINRFEQRIINFEDSIKNLEILF